MVNQQQQTRRHGRSKQHMQAYVTGKNTLAGYTNSSPAHGQTSKEAWTTKDTCRSMDSDYTKWLPATWHGEQRQMVAYGKHTHTGQAKEAWLTMKKTLPLIQQYQKLKLSEL